MSWETDRLKLQKLWEAAQQNGIDIDITRTNLYLQGQQAQELPSRQLNINQLADQGGGWQNASLLVDEPDGSNEITVVTTGGDVTPFELKVIGYSWSIVFNNLPVNWIPFIRWHVAYDGTNGPQILLNPLFHLDPAGAAVLWFNLQQNVQVEYPNDDDTSTTGKVTFNVSVTLYQDTQVRLYVTLLTPYSFK